MEMSVAGKKKREKTHSRTTVKGARRGDADSLVVVKETMASKGLIKRVRQLQQKKYRTQTNQFVVEGSRAITEFIKNKDAFDCVHLLTTNYNEVVVHRGVLDHVVDVAPRYQCVTPSEMSKMTGLSTACDSLAVFQRKLPDETSAEEVRQNFRDSQLSLALDSVRDPGNLGTLIRLCDWFGMKNLLLSSDCCDCYNPKVVRATSGGPTTPEFQRENERERERDEEADTTIL